MQEAAALFAALDRELWVVTASAGGRRGGLLATAVCQASLSPHTPRVLVGLAKHHHTWELVEASGALALHLLDEDRLDLAWHFGLHSGRDRDKLDGLNVTTAATKSPILSDTPGWLDCRVEDRLDTGDRTVYLAEVVQAHWRGGRILTLKRLIERASPERLQQLRHLVEQDRVLEAAAVRRWRERRTEPREATR